MSQTNISLPRDKIIPFMASSAALVSLALFASPAPAALVIGNNPLFLVNSKSNVLVMLDNSNSMDEDPSGKAVGSASASSKSEIARGVVRTLTDKYQGRVNMGLMSYRINTPDSSHLHNSPYDVSFNPANYDPTFTGARESQFKRFRMPNPTSAGNYIHFNVALPFYTSSPMGNGFCYSKTAKAFNNGENPSSGPWDTYRCWSSKTGTSDALPTWRNSASEAASGFGGAFYYETGFSPTDSDLAQGIVDFGRFNTWHYVSPTWFSNSSPGRGFLNVPLGLLDAPKATAIKSKLACNVPGAASPCTTTGLRNAGLTPIEGTLLTARDYYAGTWTNSAEGYTASCYPLPQSCGKNYVILLTDGLPSTDKNGALVANPASALTAAANAAQLLANNKVLTYVIGFALPYGTDPNSLNQIAVAGGTSGAYNAGDPASLQAAFDAIFDDIFRREGGYTAVAQSSTSLTDGARVFQATFNSSSWSGELKSVQPKADGTQTVKWSSNDAGRIAAWGQRKVFTLKPGVGGAAFKDLATLTTAQQTALGVGSCGGTLTTTAACAQARIDWLRGNRSSDVAHGGPLRARADATVLGDIVDSPPVYVKDSNTVFVGANDGMLHAFDANTGEELFAYVPNAVISNLYKLTATNYGHEYYVDGEIAVSSRASTPGGKNILVGALGRGGKALYALDVTDPSTFDSTKVLWEFTDADLGMVLGRPIIVKLNNGKTAVMVGNGINSTSERAVLFLIDITTGALIQKIDTLAGSTTASNSLSSPRGWDDDANGTLDYVYAGDLLGNLWKFDLTSSNPSQWRVAYGTTGAPAPLFVATDSSGVRQPITGMPDVGIDARQGDLNFGRRFVFFGTGRYLLSGDVGDMRTQSWYGLIDNGSVITGRSSLRQRTVVSESTVSGQSIRKFSAATSGDMAGKSGWYLDMTGSSGATYGERFVGEQKYFGAVLFASSIVPSADTCQPGGSGYVNSVDPFTGGALSKSFFDIDGNGKFDDVGDSMGISGGLISDGVIVGSQLITSGTSDSSATQLGQKTVNNTIRTGRVGWREIVRQP